MGNGTSQLTKKRSLVGVVNGRNKKSSGKCLVARNKIDKMSGIMLGTLNRNVAIKSKELYNSNVRFLK